jgi:uncharacterized protein YbjT (DUF2867 family)
MKDLTFAIGGTGRVVLPVADIPEPFVDAEDIAEVAAAALTDDGHAGQLYELTGPRALLALLRYLFTEVLDGRNVNLADGVQRALGRPARDFADFARRAAARGIWRAP